MRDDPYPARFYGRLVDEPALNEMALAMPHDDSLAAIFPLHHHTHRILLLLLMIYLGCALFLIFTVSSYAAPLENVTITPQDAAGCVDVMVAAAH
jgi:hypothetical protein